MHEDMMRQTHRQKKGGQREREGGRRRRRKRRKRRKKERKRRKKERKKERRRRFKTYILKIRKRGRERESTPNTTSNTHAWRL